jgi:hypothetical protein
VRQELLAIALVAGGAWAPAPGPPQQLAAEIAAHVAPKYRAEGRQLVSVVPSRPHVLKAGHRFRVRKVAVANRQYAIVAVHDAAHQQDFTLCGGGSHCSIVFGKPTRARFRLGEREALELVLDTFRFSPSIDAVVVYIPPPPGQTLGPVLYFRRGELKDDIGDPRTLDPAVVDRLALPHLHSYASSGLAGGGMALVLLPY